MAAKIRELLLRYKGLILYGVFGVLTTLINMAVYHLCFERWGWSNVLSVGIACMKLHASTRRVPALFADNTLCLGYTR